MLHFDSEALSRLAMTPEIARRAAALYGSDPREASLLRLTEVHRDRVSAHDGHVERSARVALRLMRALGDEGTALAVGDWVIVGQDTAASPWVDHRVPPVSHIVRRDGDGRRHPLVSNVDTALLVMGLDDDFNPRRLERFVALVSGSGVRAVAVLTKADVVAADVDARVALIRARCPAGMPVVAVNATDRSAAAALGPYVGGGGMMTSCSGEALPGGGHTLVMLGSSGAGKSTLTNTLLDGPVQDTGPVRSHDSRGKHTTTSRSLHFLPGGTCIIDTPGLRTLRPDGDASALAEGFPDIEREAARCRFRDCRHAGEPGCAVREGIDPDRLRNYQKLMREMRRDTQTARDRQRQLSEWKARTRVSRERMMAKRG